MQQNQTRPPDSLFFSSRPSLVTLAWQTWVILAVLCVLCSLLQVAERFAACAEVSEQVSMFLVCDGGALCTDVNGPRCAVVIPWDREGQGKDVSHWETELQWVYKNCKIKSAHILETGVITDTITEMEILCVKVIDINLKTVSNSSKSALTSYWGPIWYEFMR